MLSGPEGGPTATGGEGDEQSVGMRSLVVQLMSTLTVHNRYATYERRTLAKTDPVSRCGGVAAQYTIFT